MNRPHQHRQLKWKDSIQLLVLLDFSRFFIRSGLQKRFFSICHVHVRIYLKQLCCFQICLMLPVVFLRCQITVGRVDAPAVIKYPDIFKGCGFCLLPCMKMLFIQPFVFQFLPEAFHRRIVPVQVRLPAPDNDNLNPVPIGDGFGFLVYLKC